MQFCTRRSSLLVSCCDCEGWRIGLEMLELHLSLYFCDV